MRAEELRANGLLLHPDAPHPATDEDDSISDDLLSLLQIVAATKDQEQSDDGQYHSPESDDSDGLSAAFAQAMSSSRAGLIEFVSEDSYLDDFFDPSGAGRATPEQEDFEPEDYAIYHALRTHMRALVGKASKPAQRLRSLRWMMMPISDKQGLVFEDACIALQSRVTVIRTRAFYQMWLNSIAIDETVSDLMAPLSRSLRDEIDMHPIIGRIPGVTDLAGAIWSNPGRLLSEAFERSKIGSAEKIRHAFSALVDYGYVGQTTHGRVYFLARNPSLLPTLRRTNFSWSQSFVSDD